MRPLDERSDIYALGLIMFEMATGRRPFKGKSTAEILEMHRRAIPPAPHDLNPDVPMDFSQLTLRCLTKNPSHRVQSARKLHRALERLQVNGPSKRRWFGWGQTDSDTLPSSE